MGNMPVMRVSAPTIGVLGMALPMVSTAILVAAME